jgi:hypothetical protein
VSRRQRVFFNVGCYASLLTAGLHMLGHSQGAPPPASEAQAMLFSLMRSEVLDIAGSRLTLQTLTTGYSLMFSLLLVWLAALGLFVIRRGSPEIVTAVARFNAAFMALLLAVSAMHFPLPPTICIAVILVGFAGASFGQR